MRFVGHEQPEWLAATARVLKADLGGGAGQLTFGDDGGSPRRLKIEGGPGRADVRRPDRGRQRGRSLDVRLPGALRLEGRKLDKVRGFEQAVLVARRITAVGSAADDSVLADEGTTC